MKSCLQLAPCCRSRLDVKNWEMSCLQDQLEDLPKHLGTFSVFWDTTNAKGIDSCLASVCVHSWLHLSAGKFHWKHYKICRPRTCHLWEHSTIPARQINCNNIQLGMLYLCFCCIMFTAPWPMARQDFGNLWTATLFRCTYFCTPCINFPNLSINNSLCLLYAFLWASIWCSREWREVSSKMANIGRILSSWLISQALWLMRAVDAASGPSLPSLNDDHAFLHLLTTSLSSNGRVGNCHFVMPAGIEWHLAAS